MFIHYRGRGLIFKKEERGEADLLFTVYTKDFGKLEILGKSVRKIASKLRPSAEVFYLSEIEFIQGKIQKTLTDATLVDKFSGIRGDLKKIRIAHKISEVLDNLIKGQEPDEKIWRLLIETFQKLNDLKLPAQGWSASGGEIIYCYFYWNFISILGYRPELYHCVRCRKKIITERNYLVPEEGGIICGSCKSEGRNISPEAIKILRIILKRDWATLFKLKFEAQYLKELICVNYSSS
ncbi:MAG: DNA repair protein RecO [Patescibacteria group bacterium]